MLRNFLAFSFAEDLFFMHKEMRFDSTPPCASSVFFKLSLNLFPKSFASFQSCFQGPCLKYKKKENNWV